VPPLDVTTLAARDKELWRHLQAYAASAGTDTVKLEGAIELLRSKVDNADSMSILTMDVYMAGENGICIMPSSGPSWPIDLYGADEYCFDLESDQALALMHEWFHNRVAWAFSILGKKHPLKRTILGRFANVMEVE